MIASRGRPPVGRPDGATDDRRPGARAERRPEPRSRPAWIRSRIRARTPAVPEQAAPTNERARQAEHSMRKKPARPAPRIAPIVLAAYSRPKAALSSSAWRAQVAGQRRQGRAHEDRRRAEGDERQHEPDQRERQRRRLERPERAAVDLVQEPERDRRRQDDRRRARARGSRTAAASAAPGPRSGRRPRCRWPSRRRSRSGSPRRPGSCCRTRARAGAPRRPRRRGRPRRTGQRWPGRVFA